MELVTVIMPIYNNQDYLSQAIESILHSDYAAIEIILIDDASIDSSALIAQRYAAIDRRIHYYKNSCNLGTALSIKKGIEKSNGNYIFIAAADDITLPNRISKCMEIFRVDSSIGLIFSHAIVINSESILTGEEYTIDRRINNDNIEIHQFQRNYCLGATMAFRNDRSLLLKNGVLEQIDDYQISLEFILAGYDLCIIREPLIKYRLHDHNQSNQYKALTEKTIDVLKQYNVKEIEVNLVGRGFSRAEIYVTLGIFELFRRNNEPAHFYLRQAESYPLTNDLFRYQNYFYLGVIHYSYGIYKDSLNYFLKAYELDHREATLLNNLGVLYFILFKDVNQAVDYFERSIKLEVNYIDAQNNLINIQQNKYLKLTERLMHRKSLKRTKYST